MIKNLLCIICNLLTITAEAQFNTIPLQPSCYHTEPTPQKGMEGKAKKAEVPISTASNKKLQTARYKSVSFPLKDMHVASPFGKRRDPFTGRDSWHNGIDLRAKYVEVYSMLKGVVVKTGRDKRSGKFVTLRHGNFIVCYCHLSKILVRTGDWIMPGEAIGISGNSGKSTGPHLHLTLKYQDKCINPEILLRFIENAQRKAQILSIKG